MLVLSFHLKLLGLLGCLGMVNKLVLINYEYRITAKYEEIVTK